MKSVQFRVGDKYNQGEEIHPGEFYFGQCAGRFVLRCNDNESQIFIGGKTRKHRAIQVGENPLVEEPKEGEWWMCKLPDSDEAPLVYRRGVFRAFASGWSSHKTATPLYKMERAK